MITIIKFITSENIIYPALCQFVPVSPVSWYARALAPAIEITGGVRMSPAVTNPAGLMNVLRVFSFSNLFFVFNSLHFVSYSFQVADYLVMLHDFLN